MKQATRSCDFRSQKWRWLRCGCCARVWDDDRAQRPRTLPQQGVPLSVSSVVGTACLSVSRKLRRACFGNPSNLGMEVLKRMANRESPRLGLGWRLSVEDSLPSGMVAAEH